MAAAERRAAAANAQIGVARAAFFPDITLQALGGFQNTGGGDLLGLPNSYLDRWDRSLAGALFDGGRRGARGSPRAGPPSTRRSADYRAAVLRAFRDVEDQLALPNQLAAEADGRGRGGGRRPAHLDLALIRYRPGAANYLEVVTAQTAALTAEQTALTAQDAPPAGERATCPRAGRRLE